MSDSEAKTTLWPDIISGRPEQKEAITSTAALTVVSAGAGTGKTHTLAQRFAWLLASDKSLNVDEILVLTFTEKAAREMAERIKSTVEKWYAKFPAELAHLGKSIKFMDDACISTIHSFAMKVIRESALTLDIDPTAVIIPTPKEELWWEQYAYSLGTLSPAGLSRFLDGKWKRRAEELFAGENFPDFVSEYGPGNLAQAAKTASETLGGAGKTPEELWNQDYANISCDVESLRGYPGQVRNLWINSVLPDITEEMRSEPGERLRRLMEILAEHSRLEASEDNSAAFCGLLFSEGLASLPGRSKIKDVIANALGEDLKRWRDRERAVWLRAALPSDAEKTVADLLNRACSLGWRCWDELRAKEDLLSMNDLIRYAGEALAKAPDEGKKFKHILVDEFQDTDRLQDNLLRSLWNEGGNTLFIVGDLKQSIYRFRHADLRIFQDYIASSAAETSGKYKYITLGRSYRTKGELLGVFNDIFDNLWADGLEKGTAMRYEPLAGPDDEDWWGERNAPQLLPVFEPCIAIAGATAAEDGGGETDDGQRKKEGKETVSDARLRLFRYLGRRMSQMRSDGEKIWDKTADTAGFREIRWSDFALLVPTRSVYPLIEKAFDSIGVPYVLCTSKNYFSRGEVADVVNLVALLAEPENPLYLAGWIASPLSGAGHGEAQECMEEAQRRKEKKGELPLAETVRQIIPAVWAEVERLRKLALLRGVSYAILELMKTRSFLVFYEPGQRRSVIANLTRLASVAEEYEASEGRSLTSFADYLKMITISETQQEEPDAADEDEDAVRVLTIHASKGLEYPVVAVLCGGGRVSGRSKIFISLRYGAGAVKIPSFLGGSGKEDTVTCLWHGAGEKDRESAERERLYYVALTRARDKVFLCSTARLDEKAGLKSDSLDPFMQNVASTVVNGEKIEPHIVEQIENYQPPQREKIHGIFQNKLLELPETFPAKLGRLSASAYAMLAWCPNAYRIAYRQGRNLRWVNEGGEGQGGADFGALAHWILSRWNFTAAALGEWLPQPETEAYEMTARLLPAYLREIFADSAAHGELKKMLSVYAAGADGKLMASLAAAASLVRETRFRVLDKPLVLVGSTDVMWEDDAYVHIRDWKTAAEDTAPDEYYLGQLEFYAYAVWSFRKNRGLREKAICVALNYLRHDQSKSETLCLSGGEMPGIGSKIHAAAELALSGEFKKELSRCEKCPWRYDCSSVKRLL